MPAPSPASGRSGSGEMAVPIQRAITNENVAALLPASSLELFNDGAHKFRRLKEDLAGAQRFIHMQYFIWEQDRLTAELVPILLDRLEAGVEVRIMYDWMGCISFRKAELRQLARAGAQVAGRRHRPPAHQLPQPPQDRRRRRRDRLHRRHERRPGVHRRRQALRNLARHAHAPRPARRSPRSRSSSRRAGSSTRRTHENLFVRGVHAGARPGRRGDRDAGRGGRAGGRRPWSATRRTHMVAIGQAEESVLDPVAVLHPRLQHLRRDDQRRRSAASTCAS